MAGREWWRSVRDVTRLHALMAQAEEASRQKTELVRSLEARVRELEGRRLAGQVGRQA